MIVQDQRAVIALLASPGTHHSAAVEQIETHSAIVFLAGDRAWKLKRAVRYDYLDFSTVERRRQLCEAEVALNRRTAPQLYKGVVAVTRRADGTLELGGTGEPVEWVIEMTRFDQEQLCDRLAASGALQRDDMERLAAAVARLHRGAAVRDAFGGPDGMRWVVDGNASGLAAFGGSVLDLELLARVTTRARHAIESHGVVLDARRSAGYVRQCHGDLHLRNVVMIDGAPTLFDAVEFNDAIACIDVWYDVAFLLMDLQHRGLAEHANTVFNRYLSDTGDYGGLPLLPLFLSCRAAVRAKTSATSATFQTDRSRRDALRTLSSRYLSMADALLTVSWPIMVAIGGLSGTGKSTLTRDLAPALGPPPGAVVLRSDEIRKELAGVSRHHALGPASYTAEMSAQVYRTMLERARRALTAGRSVIVDAVHARPADRDAVERVAADAGAAFAGLWLEAPIGALVDRVNQRRGDASDADAAVIRTQANESPGVVSWWRIDAAQDRAQVREAALRHLAEHSDASLSRR